jgi:hypothetical protein
MPQQDRLGTWYESPDGKPAAGGTQVTVYTPTGSTKPATIIDGVAILNH